MKRNLTVSIIILNLLLIPVIGIFSNWNLACFFQNFKETLIFEFSIVSLIIALNLYDKFGINKKLTEKRIELVLGLITELKSQEGFGTNIYKNGEYLINPAFYFGVNMTGKASKRLENIENGKNNSFLDEPININQRDFNKAFKKTRRLLNNPIMPKKIVQKSSFLKLSGGFNNEELRARKVIFFVYFKSEAKKELIENDGNTWTVSFNNDCTLREFLVKFEGIFRECQKWANKHSDISEDLNYQNFDLNS